LYLSSLSTLSSLLFFFLIIRPPPTSTLFPYTTLFRSGLTSANLPMCIVPAEKRSGFAAAIRNLYPSLTPAFEAWLTRDADLAIRSEEHTSELQSPYDLVCRLLLEKKNNKTHTSSYKKR